MILATYQGVTNPQSTLIHEISVRGWTVSSVKWSDKEDAYTASASAPTGDSIERAGKTPETALGAVLSHILRLQSIRALGRYAAWQTAFSGQMEPIAKAYAKAPIFDPKAAGAWKALADDSVARAKVLGQQLHIEVTDKPEPYATAQEMAQDIHKNRHFWVSRANSQHPVWTTDQNVAFRTVHDVLGHAASGGDFGWEGEHLACSKHFPLLTPEAQRALFTECIGSLAYTLFYRAFGPQKVAFLDEFMTPAQRQENPLGHSGVHPQDSQAPTWMPDQPSSSSEEELGGAGWGNVAPHMESPWGFTPVMTKKAGVIRDPNFGFETGIDPISDAYLGTREMTADGNVIDPLDSQAVYEHAKELEVPWWSWQHEGAPDLGRMKQAIVNAFRVVLLSPRKELKWNAQHYQDIQHVPPHITDPKVYWDALENARQEWNVKLFGPEARYAHRAYQKFMPDFYAYFAQLHPGLHPEEVKERADQEIFNLTLDIEQELARDAKPDEILEPKVFAQLAKYLKALLYVKGPKGKKQIRNPNQMSIAAVHPEQNQMDIADDAIDLPEKYGAFMGSHLKSLARISAHADQILEGALEDVQKHDGTGSHFRQTVLRLKIPGVGPKVASFAWLLLAPMTSQLATMDVHMMGALGHKYDKEMNPRDYFKFERELQAMRDASGYGHIPLGQFQWGLWDYKRSGPGQHQDHSAMRVWNPTPTDNIDWKSITSLADQWEEPDWIAATQPARDQVAQDWEENVAPNFARQQIPWQEEPVSTHAPLIARGESSSEISILLMVPEPIRQRIYGWAQTLDIPEKDLVPPDEYHITLAHAKRGMTRDIHRALEGQNFSGLKFEAQSVSHFDSAVALKLRSDDYVRAAEAVNQLLKDNGVRPEEYESGPIPHITVAYTSSYKRRKAPPVTFRAQNTIIAPERGKRVVDPLYPILASWDEVHHEPIRRPIQTYWWNDDEGLIRPKREFGGRRPLIYSARDRALHVGAPDAYHEDVFRHFSITPHLGHHYGFIGGSPDAARRDEYGDQDEVGWYNHPSQKEQLEVLDEIQKQIPKAFVAYIAGEDPEEPEEFPEEPEELSWEDL